MTKIILPLIKSERGTHTELVTVHRKGKTFKRKQRVGQKEGEKEEPKKGEPEKKEPMTEEMIEELKDQLDELYDEKTDLQEDTTDFCDEHTDSEGWMSPSDTEEFNVMYDKSNELSKEYHKLANEYREATGKRYNQEELNNRNVPAKYDELKKNMETYEEAVKSATGDTKIIDAVSDYTASDYTHINQYLRNPDSKPNEKIDEAVSDISAFLDKAPKVNGTVYRGMDFSKDDENALKNYDNFLNNFKSNEVVNFKSFTSTSTSKDTAAFFTDPKRAYTILFEIKSKNGVYLNGVSDLPNEHEVLFNKDSNFKITKIDKDEHPTNVRIFLEEV